MNDHGKQYLEHNGELQLAIVKLLAAHPQVTFKEWSSHLLLCGAAMAMAAGIGQEDTQGLATYAVDLAYSTTQDPPQKIH